MVKERKGTVPTRRVKALLSRGRRNLDPWGEHKDKDITNHTWIQLLLLGTKYDHLQRQKPAKRQILCRGFRFLAHIHGAHLLFLEEINPSAKAQITANNRKGNLEAYRSLLNHLAFNGFDKRVASFKLPIQRDHQHPLLILAGNDDLLSIGDPAEGHTFSTIDSALASWKDVILNTFPPRITKSSPSGILKTHAFIDKGIFTTEDPFSESVV